MPKTLLAGLLTLALLAVLSPEKAIAGPPEGVSGQMVLAPDGVADWLRRYRLEKDPEKRIRLLEFLAQTRDPRVAVALGDALKSSFEDVRWAAISLIHKHYLPPPHEDEASTTARTVRKATAWWEKNAADLRRRAKQLPR